MKNTDITEIEECEKELASLRETHKLDQYEERAFTAIIERLSFMRRQILNKSTGEQEQLRGVIARLVVEQNPSILPPELGGRLIDIEKKFYTKNA